jgi:hypothetical protein
MADEKEVARLMGIARGRAKAALAQPQSRREAFLAQSRLSWKRYAADFTKKIGEQERFADILDRVTRDLMVVEEDAPEDPPLRDDERYAAESVEGAMDSVLVHEAAYVPLAAMPEKTAEAADEDTSRDDGDPPAPDNAGAADPEAEEDRPRYGFAAMEIAASRRQALKADMPGRSEPLENAGDLQRKVQAVLRAHREAKMRNDPNASDDR